MLIKSFKDFSSDISGIWRSQCVYIHVSDGDVKVIRECIVTSFWPGAGLPVLWSCSN